MPAMLFQVRYSADRSRWSRHETPRVIEAVKNPDSDLR
jgi:hypothetical protein